jgi:hypothetical protein
MTKMGLMLIRLKTTRASSKPEIDSITARSSQLSIKIETLKMMEMRLIEEEDRRVQEERRGRCKTGPPLLTGASKDIRWRA